MSAVSPERQERRTPGLPEQVDPEELEDALRAAAIASLRRKRKLAENILAYATVNGVLWVIWALTDRSTDGSIPWPAWVSAIWGFFLLVDVWKAFGPWPGRRPITEADVDREMRRAAGRTWQ